MLHAVVQEVSTLVDVSQHPNIVRFIGVCVDPPFIVTEYYPLGSLFGMLSAAREGDYDVIRSLSWPRRLQMLHDVAAGMSYLHSRNYMHGDLRTPNVFVAADGHVKIGDFGFARLLEATGGAVQNGRTTNPRWLAPEVLRTGRSSKAADIFSFGIIMWELLTWQVPYTGYYSVQVTFNHVHDNFRPELPPDELLPVSSRVNLAPYKALMAECWAQEAEAR
ncbi:kinase-like domain-containing protein [Haematococcus lacustris]